MNFIYLVAIIGMIIGCLRGIRNYSGEPDMTRKDIRLSIALETLGGTILGGIAGLVISLFVSFYVKSDLIMDKHGETKNIYAIADGNSVSGSFFLGSGYVDCVQYYYYYEQLDNNGFKQRKVRVEIATVFEHTDTTGYISAYKMVLPKGHWAIGWSVLTEWDLKYVYEIHIPKGSIRNSFNLDLE